jgi:hydrogenase maturation protease
LARVAVIGIGNTLMGDDGVGVKIAEALRDCDLGPDVRVVLGGTAGIALSKEFEDADVVLVADAIAVDDTPGSVFRFRPDDVGMAGLRSHTSHGVSLPNIMLAAQLRGFAPDVIVYAVQVGDITCGFDTLSPQVAAIVPEVAEMIAEEAARLAAERA